MTLDKFSDKYISKSLLKVQEYEKHMYLYNRYVVFSNRYPVSILIVTRTSAVNSCNQWTRGKGKRNIGNGLFEDGRSHFQKQ